MARCCWVCPCLIRRLCFDRDLFVVSPLNWSAVRMGSPLRFPSSRDVYPACVRLLTRRGIRLDQPLSVDSCRPSLRSPAGSCLMMGEVVICGDIAEPCDVVLPR